jgi:uncharacterized damage-inducible protein DinB/predicted RNase H-like HicB family nuclease
VIRYSVYLEIHSDGRTMAHIPALSGCTARATAREEALRRGPEAVREHHAWLRRHGEPALPPNEPVELEIAGENTGFGPFDPGNAAALFPPDLAPVSADEMERFIRLMGYARVDLLAPVGDLPDEILDWQPDPQSLTLRRLLRHVGNAEEWYISRIVPANTLPPEWEHDDALPIFEFLAMERRTAIERLRELTDAECSQVFYPQGWTDHPDEPWTAAKMFRRFLEHEREHTGQAREILAVWRERLLVRLAIERAGLLAQLTGLDERRLVESPVFDDWTAKDLLAHVAAWDEFFTERTELVLAGRQEELAVVDDQDAYNANLHTERRNWSLERALAACVDSRVRFLQTLAQAPDEAFHRRWQDVWGESSFRLWTQWRAYHDAEHAGNLSAWRKTLVEQAQVTWHEVGPRSVLLASLQAHREALLALMALVPAGDRDGRAISGLWTLRDVVGHLADWEKLCADVLRQMAAREPVEVDYSGNVDAWNAAHAAARRGHSWGAVWADFEAARRALLAVLDGLSDTDLNTPRPGDWGGTPYRWAYVCVDHDQEHMADLQRAMMPEMS